MKKAAKLSDCKSYRYTLYRKWDEGPSILFIMLNPSVADADIDDPTIRRCVSFAKKWGFGSLWVGNLYAYRSTDPHALKSMGLFDAIGPENDHYIEHLISKCSKIVVAWGTHGCKGTFQMAQSLRGRQVWCLGKTKHGFPKHPLYLSQATELEPYEIPVAKGFIEIKTEISKEAVERIKKAWENTQKGAL